MDYEEHNTCQIYREKDCEIDCNQYREFQVCFQNQLSVQSHVHIEWVHLFVQVSISSNNFEWSIR